MKKVFTKTQGRLFQLILLAFVLLPFILLFLDFENKLVLVALFIFAFSCVVGIFVVDDYTIRDDSE